MVLFKHFYPDGGGHDFAYQDITLPNRNSVQELEQDAEIRKAFWGVSTKDVVIDVGAGFGSYTLCALARGATAVYAFEADKEVHRILWENISNDYNRAISAVECSAINCWHVDEKTSIDSYIALLSWQPQKLDWLKIDTDNPLEVLKGAEKTIERYHPNILIRYELTPDDLPNYEKFNTLRGHTFIQ